MVEREGSTPQTDNPIPESLMLSDFHGCSEALVTGEIYWKIVYYSMYCI